MNDQNTDQPFETQRPPMIADQGAFLRQLGIDPRSVVPNSLTVEFNPEGIAVVSYRVMIGVDPQSLGLAFLAGSNSLGGGAAAESQPIEDGDPAIVTPLTQKGRRTAAKKTAAKKTTAKKAAPKKT